LRGSLAPLNDPRPGQHGGGGRRRCAPVDSNRPHPQMTPRPVQHEGGGRRRCAPVDSNRRASRSRLQRSTVHGELAVVVHSPTRQVFDQLLADHATLLACHFCDCLRDSVGDFICFSPAGETVARSAPGAHAAAAILISACLPPTPLHRSIGLRVRPLNDPHDARLRPFNRYTLSPPPHQSANRRTRHHPPVNSDSPSTG
jgi:hypothetical protein